MPVLNATQKSADAPDIEAGLYDGRFDSLSTKFIEGGQYGDGDRFVWDFTLLDDDGEVMYEDGDPLTIDGLTSLSLNTESKTTPKAVRYLKALCTEAEFEAFVAGQGVNTDDLIGRIAQVEVGLNGKGWPTIVNVLPKRKARRSRSTSDEA